MRTMTVGDFNAHVFQALGRVAKTKEAVVITSYRDLSEAPGFEKDIVAPLGEDMWILCEQMRS